jgi:hypothetical protein
MPFSGTLNCVALVRDDVSEEPSARIIRAIRIFALGTPIAVISNRRKLRRNIVNTVPSSLILVTLMMEATCCSVTPFLKRATRRNIPEDGIIHSHRRENLKTQKYFSFDKD